MNPKTYGITAETYEHMIIDAGVVYKNFVDIDNPGVLLGGTRGGNVFSVETEILDLKVDGSKGSVMGGQYIIKAIATLEVNFIESTTEIYKRALPGAVSANYPAINPTHDEISRISEIADGDYLDNIVIMGNIHGTNLPIILMIRNALSDGKLNMSLADKDEATCKIKFIGHFDPNDLSNEPWNIFAVKYSNFSVEELEGNVELEETVELG